MNPVKHSKAVPHVAYLLCIFAALASGFFLGRLHVKRSAAIELEQEKVALRNVYVKEAERALEEARNFHREAAMMSSQVLAESYKKRGLITLDDFTAGWSGLVIRKASIIDDNTIELVLGNDTRNVRPRISIDFYDQNGYKVGSCSKKWVFDEIYVGGRYSERLTVDGILGWEHVKYVSVRDKSRLW